MSASLNQVVAFHEKGRRKFPARWELMCSTLVAKGADAQIGDMILKLPIGVDVVHALFVDAEALAELVGKKTRRAREGYLMVLAYDLLQKKPMRQKRERHSASDGQMVQ